MQNKPRLLVKRVAYSHYVRTAIDAKRECTDGSVYALPTAPHIILSCLYDYNFFFFLSHIGKCQSNTGPLIWNNVYVCVMSLQTAPQIRYNFQIVLLIMN